jgi:hypothetical protein
MATPHRGEHTVTDVISDPLDDRLRQMLVDSILKPDTTILQMIATRMESEDGTEITLTLQVKD